MSRSNPRRCGVCSVPMCSAARASGSSVWQCSVVRARAGGRVKRRPSGSVGVRCVAAVRSACVRCEVRVVVPCGQVRKVGPSVVVGDNQREQGLVAFGGVVACRSGRQGTKRQRNAFASRLLPRMLQ